MLIFVKIGIICMLEGDPIAEDLLYPKIWRGGKIFPRKTLILVENWSNQGD